MADNSSQGKSGNSGNDDRSMNRTQEVRGQGGNDDNRNFQKDSQQASEAGKKGGSK